MPPKMDPERKEKIMKAVVAVVIVLIIVLIVMYLRSGSKTCPTGAVFMYNGAAVTAQELCESSEGTWDAATNSCIATELEKTCPGKSLTISKKICPLLGGKWHSKCNVCSGLAYDADGQPIGVSEESAKKAMAVYMEECPNACTIL